MHFSYRRRRAATGRANNYIMVTKCDTYGTWYNVDKYVA